MYYHTSNACGWSADSRIRQWRRLNGFRTLALPSWITFREHSSFSLTVEDYCTILFEIIFDLRRDFKFERTSAVTGEDTKCWHVNRVKQCTVAHCALFNTRLLRSPLYASSLWSYLTVFYARLPTRQRLARSVGHLNCLQRQWQSYCPRLLLLRIIIVSLKIFFRTREILVFDGEQGSSLAMCSLLWLKTKQNKIK